MKIKAQKTPGTLCAGEENDAAARSGNLVAFEPFVADGLDFLFGFFGAEVLFDLFAARFQQFRVFSQELPNGVLAVFNKIEKFFIEDLGKEFALEFGIDFFFAEYVGPYLK